MFFHVHKQNTDSKHIENIEMWFYSKPVSAMSACLWYQNMLIIIYLFIKKNVYLVVYNTLLLKRV